MASREIRSSPSRILKVDFDTATGTVNAVRGVDIHVEGRRNGCHCRRKWLRQEPDHDGGHGAPGRPTATRQVKSFMRERNILKLPIRQLNDIRTGVRGEKITMIFPRTHDVAGPALYGRHGNLPNRWWFMAACPGKRRNAKALELLKLVNIPEPERKIKALSLRDCLARPAPAGHDCNGSCQRSRRSDRR